MKFTLVVDFEIDRAGGCTAGTVTVFESTGLVGVPEGGVPTTEATFTTEPASRSACVTVCVPLQVVDTPGANVVTGQVTPAVFGSDTATLVSVTFPVLVTTNEYAMVLPTALYDEVLVDLTIDSDGDCTAGTVTVFEGTGMMGVPDGGVPTALATFTTEPELRSA